MANQPLPSVASATSALTNTLIGIQGGAVKQFALNAIAAGYTHSATGAIARLFADKFKEHAVSVTDFGADKTGVADSTTAFTNAIHSGAHIIFMPDGTYKVTKISIDRDIWLVGTGRNACQINCTTTGANHGMDVVGTGYSPTHRIRLIGFTLNYTGAGQTAASGENNCWSGIYLRNRTIMEDVVVSNFTNDGLYFAANNSTQGATSTDGSNTQCSFFGVFMNCRFGNNGRDGCRIRFGANANLFINCDFSNNDGAGLHHVTEGAATYGNIFIGGQASYNDSYGYYFESGTNIVTMGTYHENNGNSYANTPFDVYVGDNCSRSDIQLGVLYNNDFGTVRAPARGLNDSVYVHCGGQRIFGSTGYFMPYTSSSLADSNATTVAGIVSDFNALLARLRSSRVVGA